MSEADKMPKYTPTRDLEELGKRIQHAIVGNSRDEVTAIMQAMIAGMFMQAGATEAVYIDDCRRHYQIQEGAKRAKKRLGDLCEGGKIILPGGIS